MATLEDKILGEPLHNYCSSSEESEGSDSEGESKKAAPVAKASLPEPNKWEGTSTNTGPKGVLSDWEKYKQLEQEKRVEETRQKIELMKKLTMTVQTALDAEKEQAVAEDPDLAQMLDDEFLLNYQKQRMKEMLEQTCHNQKFGSLILLNNSDAFLDAVDKEHKAVTVIVHIYEDNVPACSAMNQCLKHLARLYDTVKFCTIVSSRAGMSEKFRSLGVPALLVYKGGQLVGNFISLADEFGADFLPEDVQGYLIEHGMLEDKSCTPLMVRSNDSDDDSS